MKKSLHRILGILILFVMLLSILINFGGQVRHAHKSIEASSDELFWQIDQLISQNRTELQQVKDEFANICLLRAETAAYILQYRPSVLDDQEEMEKVARLLQVDEFHVFDAEGRWFAGSEPKYQGYTFNSGEQMQFFLPMLEDRSLKLCQEFAPNTAEGKLMQYAAVWMENGENIVQIGLDPQRVLEATQKNELSYIFSLLTYNSGSVLYAVDPDTYEILGSTQQELVGQKITDIGLLPSQFLDNTKGFSATVSGIPSYCYFSRENNVILGRVIADAVLYQHVYRNIASLLLYLTIVAFILIISITYYLDKKVLNSIDVINQKLQLITAGNLEERIHVDTSPEFTELSSHINQMVESLLFTGDTLSRVLNTVKIPIGIYEYNPKQFLATDRVSEILALSGPEQEKVLSDPQLLEEKLQAIRRCPVEGEKNVFRISDKKYIRIESFTRGESAVGILTDVTKEILEKEQIKRERDEDQLTGLLNRRAFYAQASELFADKETLGYACIFMIDGDYLKEINDSFGHEAGDLYLCQIADVFRAAASPNWTLARIGGDEFAVLIFGCDTPDQRQQQISVFRSCQQNGIFRTESGWTLPLAFSAGCAYYPEDGTDFRALINCADDRMYEEKRARKQPRN